MILKKVSGAIVLGALAMAFVAVPAFAQDGKDKGAAPKMDAAAEASMMAEAMKMAAPGPEHAILQSQAGKWKAVTKSWMGPGEPEVSEGTAEYEMILGGRFQMSRYHSKMMGQPFEGFSIMGYDRMAKSYTGFWLDTMGTAVYPMTGGTWDDAAKTMTFNVAWPNPMGAGTMPFKMVTKINGPDSMVFLMTMTHEGKEMPTTEVTYTRIK